MSRLEKAANIALLVACTLVVGNFARNYYRSYQATRPLLRKGQAVKLPEPRQDKTQDKTADNPGHETLVLALSTQCGHCKASVPFYQKLTAFKNSAPNQGTLRMVAVLPQAREEAWAYLKENGIGADEVVSEPLDQIRVTGTPTLMLLNGQNKLEEFWIGELKPEQEATVLQRLQQACGNCKV